MEAGKSANDSVFSSSLLWHLEGREKWVAETGGFYLLSFLKSFLWNLDGILISYPGSSLSFV